MKYLLVVLCLIPVAAQAQQASPELQNAAILALQAQRNEALDRGASLAAQLQVLKKELEELKAKQAAPATPKTDAK